MQHTDEEAIMRLRLVLISTMLFGAASAAFGGEKAAKETALAKYKETGERVDCISGFGSADQMTPIDETQILFRAGKRHYLNRLSGRCNNLDSPFYYVKREAWGSQICKNDRLTVVDSSSGITAGFCRLGEFERLERLPDEAQETEEAA
ncbi:hypothetical protein SAMN06297382_2135 [Amphiplicatus metriothermophilus]|uniref:Uncharacterized protein n=2 Tax=Amphiplicatus metriothermophilus TaxID=1519374 RepID=A0A239PVE4_9PROT|nr:hypothetical protein SAMN06297382_2135 [Amphiplicatus metriothermophilus]